MLSYVTIAAATALQLATGTAITCNYYDPNSIGNASCISTNGGTTTQCNDTESECQYAVYSTGERVGLGCTLIANRTGQQAQHEATVTVKPVFYEACNGVGCPCGRLPTGSDGDMACNSGGADAFDTCTTSRRGGSGYEDQQCNNATHQCVSALYSDREAAYGCIPNEGVNVTKEAIINQSSFDPINFTTCNSNNCNGCLKPSPSSSSGTSETTLPTGSSTPSGTSNPDEDNGSDRVAIMLGPLGIATFAALLA